MPSYRSFEDADAVEVMTTLVRFYHMLRRYSDACRVLCRRVAKRAAAAARARAALRGERASVKSPRYGSALALPALYCRNAASGEKAGERRAVRQSSCCRYMMAMRAVAITCLVLLIERHGDGSAPSMSPLCRAYAYTLRACCQQTRYNEYMLISEQEADNRRGCSAALLRSSAAHASAIRASSRKGAWRGASAMLAQYASASALGTGG